MALGFNQLVCNARDCAETLNDIMDSLAEGVGLTDVPWLVRLEHNDDILVVWHESTPS